DKRCSTLDPSEAGRVSVARSRIPSQWPQQTFELIVLSEVGCYVRDLRALKRRVEETLSTDGVLVLCHSLHPDANRAHPAELVHAVLATGLHTVARHIE